MTIGNDDNDKSAAGASATTTRRRRRANNLAQSLGRMMHVKTATGEWLKSVERVRTKDSAVSLSFTAMPPSKTLVSPLVQQAAGPVISSPLESWSGKTTVPVRYACSFCRTPFQVGSFIAVDYNGMLPYPYVLSCAACNG